MTKSDSLMFAAASIKVFVFSRDISTRYTYFRTEKVKEQNTSTVLDTTVAATNSKKLDVQKKSVGNSYLFVNFQG